MNECNYIVYVWSGYVGFYEGFVVVVWVGVEYVNVWSVYFWLVVVKVCDVVVVVNCVNCNNFWIGSWVVWVWGIFVIVGSNDDYVSVVGLDYYIVEVVVVGRVFKGYVYDFGCIVVWVVGDYFIFVFVGNFVWIEDGLFNFNGYVVVGVVFFCIENFY